MRISITEKCVVVRCDQPRFYGTCRYCENHYRQMLKMKQDVVQAMIDELNPKSIKEVVENGKH